jgi:hypothetical protein
MAIYTLPPKRPFRPTPLDRHDLAGEDVMFTNRLEEAAGDFRTVTGRASVEQSVRREASANTGALIRKPEWGMGVTQALFQNSSQSVRDGLITRVRTRMLKNPRVGRFIEAEVIKLSAASGLAIVIRYDPVGVREPIVTVIGSKR